MILGCENVMPPDQSHPANLRLALKYISIGYKVLPILPGTTEKHQLYGEFPISKATQDEGKIRSMFQKYPKAAAGHVRGEEVLRIPHSTESPADACQKPAESSPAPGRDMQPCPPVCSLDRDTRVPLGPDQHRAYLFAVLKVFDLKPSQKLTLISLASFGKKIYPSRLTLAKQIGLHERQIGRILKDLREMGFIESTSGGGHSRRGNPVANQYKLYVPPNIFRKDSKGYWSLPKK